MRQHPRHPTEIPIRITAPAPLSARRRACNVSAGGLAFVSDRPLEPGSIVRLCVDAVAPAFETDARIVWCRQRGSGYETGVQFLEPREAPRLRLVEQVCHIEMYRRSVFEHEHRELEDDEAAFDRIRSFVASSAEESMH